MLKMPLNFQLSEFIEAAATSASTYSLEDIIRVTVKSALQEELAQVRRECCNMLADLNEQWQIKYDLLRDELMTTRPTSPVQLKRPLPDFRHIVRLHGQLFENFRKPPEKRVRTQAHVQLKLDVWNPQHVNGYWLIPLHRPDQTEGRKRIKDIMEQVDELGRDRIKYAGRLGCVAVYVTRHDQLIMQYGDEIIGFDPPRTKHVDDNVIAAVLKWDWEMGKQKS
jgi:hypothetical protein